MTKLILNCYLVVFKNRISQVSAQLGSIRLAVVTQPLCLGLERRDTGSIPAPSVAALEGKRPHPRGGAEWGVQEPGREGGTAALALSIS